MILITRIKITNIIMLNKKFVMRKISHIKRKKNYYISVKEKNHKIF